MSRLWLDANVVLRFLTREPREQALRTFSLMARADSGEVELVISSLVVAEVVWVLKSLYRYPMAQITETLSPFLSLQSLSVENRSRMLEALELARDKNVDFLDAVLCLQAASRGEAVCTFDVKDFKRLPGSWVEPG